MNGKILERYTGRAAETAPPDSATPDADGTDDFGSFGWLRGVRDRAVMLELRKKSGSILAIPYGWVERVEFDPSDGITMYAGGKKICIKGRNLNKEIRAQVRLFQGITRNKVQWVQEADESTKMQAARDVTVIEEIRW